MGAGGGGGSHGSVIFEVALAPIPTFPQRGKEKRPRCLNDEKSLKKELAALAAQRF
jgi:hypothetical protein